MELSDQQCHDLAVAYAQMYVNHAFNMQGSEELESACDSLRNAYEKAYEYYKNQN